MPDKDVFFANSFDVVAAYERGFIGAYCDPDAIASLCDQIKASGGNAYGTEACQAYGLVESGLVVRGVLGVSVVFGMSVR